MRVLFAVVLLGWAAQEPVADKVNYVVREQGYWFRAPVDWTVSRCGEAEGAHLTMLHDTKSGAAWTVVAANVGHDADLDQIVADRRQLQAGAAGKDVVISVRTLERLGTDARELRIEAGGVGMLVVERMFLQHDRMFILQTRMAVGCDSSEIDAVDESFRFCVPEQDIQDPTFLGSEEAAKVKPATIPRPDKPVLRLTKGTSGTIVLLRSRGDFDADAREFARALPFSGVDGAPVCLLVEEALTSAQIDLLNRLPVAELIAVGEMPAELRPHVTQRLKSVTELATPSRLVVVSSLHTADVLEAAPLAVLHGVPLVIRGQRSVAEQLESLGAGEVLLVARRESVALPDSVEVVDLSEPADRWEHVLEVTHEPPYLAVGNLGAARSRASGAVFGAALLAACHRGMLILFEEEVQFHYAELTATAEVPEGVESTRALTGRFQLPEGELAVAIPSLGELVAISPVDKYADALLDFDSDGRFDAEEEAVPAGEVREVGDTPYSFSVRLIGAIGVTKFLDGQRTDRAVAITPPAEVLAAEIFTSIDGLANPQYLLIAGDHREFPHDYVKDPVYAESTMHEQELCTDNLYADPDGDGYLDLAVGRLVSSSAVTATTIASRMSAYAHLRGDWRARSSLIYPVWPEDEIKLVSPMVFASFEAFMRGVDLDLAATGFENRLHLRDQGDLYKTYPDLSGNALLVFAHHAGPTSWMFRMQGSGPDDLQLLIPRSKDPGPGTGVVPPLDGAPIVMSLGCDSAGLDYEVVWDNALVHSFFEEGAVAYLGNTRAGFPDTEEHLFRHVIQAMTGLATPEAEPLSLGESFRRGKNYLAFLIEMRGPFRSTPPFENYATAMRREWHSLICYGDPALRLTLPAPDSTRAVEMSIEGSAMEVANTTKAGAWTLRVKLQEEVHVGPVWIMEQVGMGPLREITSLTTAGLCYGSVPWGTYPQAFAPGTIAPGIFIDVELPAHLGAQPQLTGELGPDWSLGAWRIVTDSEGNRRLQLAVDLIRYAMAAPEDSITVEEAAFTLRRN